MPLVLPLVLLVVKAIGHGGEQRFEFKMEGVEVAGAQGSAHTVYPGAVLHVVLGKVARGEHVDEALANLLVGKIEEVFEIFGIEVLDGEVAALVEHRQGALHVGLIVDELGAVVPFSC